MLYGPPATVSPGARKAAGQHSGGSVAKLQAADRVGQGRGGAAVNLAGWFAIAFRLAGVQAGRHAPSDSRNT
jgi:hypothetical protein